MNVLNIKSYSEILSYVNDPETSEYNKRRFQPNFDIDSQIRFFRTQEVFRGRNYDHRSFWVDTYETNIALVSMPLINKSEYFKFCFQRGLTTSDTHTFIGSIALRDVAKEIYTEDGEKLPISNVTVREGSYFLIINNTLMAIRGGFTYDTDLDRVINFTDRQGHVVDSTLVVKKPDKVQRKANRQLLKEFKAKMKLEYAIAPDTFTFPESFAEHAEHITQANKALDAEYAKGLKHLLDLIETDPIFKGAFLISQKVIPNVRTSYYFRNYIERLTNIIKNYLNVTEDTKVDRLKVVLK